MVEKDDRCADAAVEAALARLRAGDQTAWQEILPLLYSELHAVARREMSRQSVSHTLQPTALVNEAFVKLCRGTGVESGQRADFMALAATAMRSILTDHARGKSRQKRSPEGKTVAISEILDIALAHQQERTPLDVIELNDLIERYKEQDPLGARLVELRYFLGQSTEEAAAILAVSPRTGRRMWSTAKAWFKRELAK
ncbi:MAG: ECF-type sigma factor [bacterium]|nr:ECF-type sigma factor [bacterium]